MRFDTPIYFQVIKQGIYDTATGNYGEDTVAEEKVYANVVETGVETLKLVYGELKQGTYQVCLQNRYIKPFDRIRIGNKTYRVDFSRSPRIKQTFVVSEVQ